MRTKCSLVALLVLLAWPPLAGHAAAAPPDIVVILTDDMNSDDWQALPQTQALLADGVWFPNFIITTPLCCPSRASLFSGQYAHNHGVRTNRIGWSGFRDDEATALPALLPRYETALIGKYLNGYGADAPTPPGWDVWFPYRGDPSYTVAGAYSTDAQAALAVDFLAAASGPRLLWFAPYAPHKPAIPAPRYAGAFPAVTGLRGDRLRSLLAVDDAVAAIAAAMGPRWDTACVFVLSDNGFLLDEGGKNLPRDGAVRVAMLARCDGLGRGTDERIVANIDIAPTILRAAGEPVPETMDGRAIQDGARRRGILIEGWEANAADHPWQRVWTRDGILNRDVAGAWIDALRACAGETCRVADGG